MFVDNTTKADQTNKGDAVVAKGGSFVGITDF